MKKPTDGELFSFYVLVEAAVDAGAAAAAAHVEFMAVDTHALTHPPIHPRTHSSFLSQHACPVPVVNTNEAATEKRQTCRDRKILSFPPADMAAAAPMFVSNSLTCMSNSC